MQANSIIFYCSLYCSHNPYLWCATPILKGKSTCAHFRSSTVRKFYTSHIRRRKEGAVIRWRDLTDNEKRLVEHPQLQMCSQKCGKSLFVSVNFNSHICHLGLISFITMQARNHSLKSERCSPRPTTKCAQLADPRRNINDLHEEVFNQASVLQTSGKKSPSTKEVMRQQSSL